MTIGLPTLWINILGYIEPIHVQFKSIRAREKNYGILKPKIYHLTHSDEICYEHYAQILCRGEQKMKWKSDCLRQLRLAPAH